MFTIPIEPWQIVLALGIVFVGSTVQASVGFGFGLIAAPTLFLIDPIFVPGPVLVPGVVLTVLVAHREREHIDLGGLKFAVTGRILGTIPAALVISVISATLFDIVFGLSVLFAVALSALGYTLEPTRGRALAAGGISGFMATLTSIGGPPIALLYQNARGPVVRGTLSGFFMIGASVSILALIVAGFFGVAEFLVGILLIPGVLLGFLVSRLLVHWFDRHGVRLMILVLSSISALAVLTRAFLATLSG